MEARGLQGCGGIGKENVTAFRDVNYCYAPISMKFQGDCMKVALYISCISVDNVVLALLSQYACCYRSFICCLFNFSQTNDWNALFSCNTHITHITHIFKHYTHFQLLGNIYG